ncbi:hypothetical protein FALCPG4_002295 [Fusarium falciforme]
MEESTDPTTAVPNLYHPLDADKQELRLLEICSSEGSDSQIQVKIFPHRFEDVRGQFIPFSYVWGDPTNTETIIINGIPRKVTKNLALFLRQVRILLSDILADISWEKPALFWADAICINQNDIEERNRQVQLMGSIYGSAPTVLAWLGQAQDSHLAGNIVGACVAWLKAREKKTAGNRDWDPNCDGWMARYPEFWAFSGDVEKTNPYWDAVMTLLTLPYWERTWIFQEMALPANTMLIYGSTLILLSSLQALGMWIVKFIESDRGDCDFSFLDQEDYQALRRAVQFTMSLLGSSIAEPLNTRELLATQQRPTLALVPELAILLASDPRDKIFGLLGVMDTHLVADYNKPTIQVYSEFVSAWMREVQDLNFLLHACRMNHTEGQPRLPSWAPDWDAISRTCNARHDMVDVFPMDQYLFRNFQASSHLVSGPAHIAQSSRILTATGVVCGEVEEVYPTWKGCNKTLILGTSFCDLVRRYMDRSRLGGRGYSSRHIFQILYRTAVQDSSPVDFSARLLHSGATDFHTWGIFFLYYMAVRYVVDNDLTARQPHDLAATFLPILGIPHGTDFSRFWREEIFGGVKLEELNETDVTNWQDAGAALQWAWENHRAEIESIHLQAVHPLTFGVKFLTKDNYMGVASSAEVGDKVVVLGSCDFPVLLRPKDGHYEHISVCFVVGLMDGEANDMVDRGEAKLETFEIH